GSAAARAAAEAGCRVLLLEKAVMPRYKPCGGAIFGPCRWAMPDGFQPKVVAEISAVTLTLNGRFPRTLHVTTPEPYAFIVERAEFDAALAKVAVEAGAQVRENATVTAAESGSELAILTLATGEKIHARAVVGADGSASRIGRYVGVRCSQVDLALEIEIEV